MELAALARCELQLVCTFPSLACTWQMRHIYSRRGYEGCWWELSMQVKALRRYWRSCHHSAMPAGSSRMCRCALVRILRWFRSEAAAGTKQRWHIFRPSVLAFLCCSSVAARRVLPFETWRSLWYRSAIPSKQHVALVPVRASIISGQLCLTGNGEHVCLHWNTHTLFPASTTHGALHSAVALNGTISRGFICEFQLGELELCQASRCVVLIHGKLGVWLHMYIT